MKTELKKVLWVTWVSLFHCEPFKVKLYLILIASLMIGLTLNYQTIRIWTLWKAKKISWLRFLNYLASGVLVNNFMISRFGTYGPLFSFLKTIKMSRWNVQCFWKRITWGSLRALKIFFQTRPSKQCKSLIWIMILGFLCFNFL